LRNVRRVRSGGISGTPQVLKYMKHFSRWGVDVKEDEQPHVPLLWR
jgi:hypothetical protein